MKLETVFIEDENGEFNELDRSKFIEFVIQDNELKDFEVDGDKYEPKVVVEGLLERVESGDEEIDDETLMEFSELFSYMLEKAKASEAYIKEQKDKKKEERERKKKEKEEEKERKEKEKAELAARQEKISKLFKKGADKAASSFKKELESIKKELPKGVTLVSDEGGQGFGLSFEGEVTDETIGNLTGFMFQKEQNSRFMQNTFGFFVGQLCNLMVDRNIYPSRMQAAKALVEKANEFGRSISHPRLIESYARMDDRIPIEYRNSEIPDKAYLELANAKKVKKEKDEEKDAYEKRKKAYEEDRLSIAKDLKEGKLSEVKEVKERINKMQIDHGLKEKPDPHQKTTGEWLKIYFLCQICLDNLVGVHEEDGVTFRDEKLTTVSSASELKELQEEARLNLVNQLVNYKLSGVEVTLADLEKGSKEMEVEREVEEDGKKKKVKVKEDVPVYPNLFFDQESGGEEAPEESEEESSEEE